MVCAKRRGRSWGTCMSTWTGLCHLWAAATLIYPSEPKFSYHGRTKFSIQDQKALLIHIMYKNIQTVLAAGRCSDEYPAKDQFGRYVDPSCRDMNPGFFHVLLMNIVGRKKKSFSKSLI